MKKKQNNTIKVVLGIIIIVLSILLAVYLGGWLLFVKPIIDCCEAFDLHTLTGVQVGITAIKCLVASGVASISCLLGFTIGGSLIISD